MSTARYALGVPLAAGAICANVLGAGGCGLVGSSTSFADIPIGTITGGRSGMDLNVDGVNTNTGGENASGGVDFSDAGCYRNTDLPDHYQAPCEQPKAVPNCANGWCTVEPGCFIMGDPWCQWYRARFSNDPTQVTLTHRYRIQQFEVTQKLWASKGLPIRTGLFPDGTGDCTDVACPVGNVNWIEVLAFANLLSQDEGITSCYVLENCQGELGSGLACDSVRSTYSSVYDCPGYRLPTGAEWEYAARAGTKTTVYSGDILDTGHAPFSCYDEPALLSIAWYCRNAGLYTHPVGQKLPNDWGLYDVIGNAAEWTGSVSESYGAGPYVDWGAELTVTGLSWASKATAWQTRGGHWYEWPNTLRVSEQGAFSAFGATPGLGFRLVQTLGNGAPI